MSIKKLFTKERPAISVIVRSDSDRFDLHSACQGEYDVVLCVDGQVVNQAAPKHLVKLRHHLRQLLNRLDKPLQFPPADVLGGDVGGDLLVRYLKLHQGQMPIQLK